MSSDRMRWVTGALISLATSDAVATPASASEPVPYRDFASTGTIGLCDKAGHAITSGKVSDRPFVWTAVSSVAPPAGYEGEGRRATLYIYQPRPNTYPPEWNGDLMTSASLYSNPRHPIAAATPRDFTLAEFIQEFHPMWNGVLQLRMYVGASGKQVHTVSYPTTDIKVTGNTWKVVRGGGVACNLGTSLPFEQTPLPTPTTTQVAGSPSARPSSGTSAEASASPIASASNSSASAPVVDGAGSSGPVAANASAGAGSQPGGASVGWLGLGGLVVVLLGAAAAWHRIRGANAPRGSHQGAS